MNFGSWEMLLLLLVVLLLFGAKRLPELASGMGKSIKNFKKGLREGENEAELEEKQREKLRESDYDRTQLQSKTESNVPR